MPKDISFKKDIERIRNWIEQWTDIEALNVLEFIFLLSRCDSVKDIFRKIAMEYYNTFGSYGADKNDERMKMLRHWLINVVNNKVEK